jgi:hypothetical protein
MSEPVAGTPKDVRLSTLVRVRFVADGALRVYLAGAVTVFVLVTVVEDWVGCAGWSRLPGWRSWAEAAGAGSVMT